MAKHAAKRKLSDDAKDILIDFFEKNKPFGHRNHSLEIKKKKTLRKKNWFKLFDQKYTAVILE